VSWVAFQPDVEKLAITARAVKKNRRFEQMAAPNLEWRKGTPTIAAGVNEQPLVFRRKSCPQI
jgi:hypothetical protein